MTDLVERLRAHPTKTHIKALLDEAATALEAQAKEIEALMERVISDDTRHRAICEQWLARAETAERERVAEWNLRREAESQRDVEKAAAETLRRERDEDRAALKPFVPDPTTMDILWGDMDDEAIGTHTIKLKHFRAARAITGKD